MKQSKKLQKNLLIHTFLHEFSLITTSLTKTLLAFLKFLLNTNLLSILKPNKSSMKNSKSLSKNQTKFTSLFYLVLNQKYNNNNSITTLLTKQLSPHLQVLKHHILKFHPLLFKKVFCKHEYNYRL